MERLSIVKEGNIMRKKICEFRARNSIKNELVFIEVEYYKSSWWYINFKNESFGFIFLNLLYTLNGFIFPISTSVI